MKHFRWLAMIVAMILATGCCACAAEGDPIDENALAGLRSAVTAANRDDYDFTDKALEYLDYIGENHRDRSGADGGHDAFGDWLTAELMSFGYDPAQIEAQPFSGESLFGDPVQGQNIVLTIPGQCDEKQIIVGAHYDGTGIGDNGSGVALLLVERADAAD